MPFIVDLLPPSAKIEAAAALGLAMDQRKSKGLFSRKQYEAIEILARFGFPLKTVTWAPGETSGRCLVFDLQGLLSGNIQFALAPTIPELELDPETGEEAFLGLCQQWTKEVTNFAPSTLSFPGLITLPEQVAPLLDGEDETLLAGFEQKANPQEALEQLSQQLAAYKDAAEAWTEFKQKAYAHRDVLGAKIQEYLQEDKEAGEKSLADLSSQVETAIAAKRNETDAELAAAAEDFKQRREMLQAELERFQESYKEKADNYWREQIKVAEKNLAEIDKALARKNQEIEGAFREFERQQNAKIQEHKAELAKRLAAFENRLKRLDSAMEGFGKGYERRMTAYQQQPERVLAATVEISNERCAKAHNAVFYAARYPGGRWKVFPPQSLGSRGIIGAVSGLFGGLNLPFKPASKLAETLAGMLEKMLPGSELADRLIAANLLDQEDFLPGAKTGLTNLIDQGKLDKKHVNLFAELMPAKEEPKPAQEEPAPQAEPVPQEEPVSQEEPEPQVEPAAEVPGEEPEQPEAPAQEEEPEQPEK